MGGTSGQPQLADELARGPEHRPGRRRHRPTFSQFCSNRQASQRGQQAVVRQSDRARQRTLSATMGPSVARVSAPRTMPPVPASTSPKMQLRAPRLRSASRLHIRTREKTSTHPTMVVPVLVAFGSRVEDLPAAAVFESR